MKTREYTKDTGKLKTFHLENELHNILKVPANKPSSRIIRTKSGRRAIEGLIDIEMNHNHSWYEEIKLRAEKDPNAIALFYRGTKVTFKEMLERADNVAKVLATFDIDSTDKIPACLSNTPETVYLLLAINKLGAQINLISPTFNKEYIAQILANSSKKVFLTCDENFASIKDIVSQIEYKNIVMNSLTDSLPEDPTKCDEYEPTLDKYYHYNNYIELFKQDDNRIVDFKSFEKIGIYSDIEIKSSGNLDTPFLVSYTSGSTKIGYPSPIVHNNRSLIVSGRFHDSDLSGNPDLRGLRGMAHIHTDSNTDIITCISDNLMQLWSVALEPEYGTKTALDVIFINKPNYLNMTTSHLVAAFKDYLINKKFHENGKGRKMPWLFACFAVGEQTSLGEEKFINKGLRIARAGSGVKIKGFSLPFTTLCVGGGDCEHGGIYYTLWKSLYDKKNYLLLKDHQTGLFPEAYVHISAFKPISDGTYEECDYNEYGIIASNSATTMSHYDNNPQKTEEMIITDVYGRDWITNNVYGYIDKLGGVHVKGRVGYILNISNNMQVPAYILEDSINKDTKNIMSCTVCKTGNEDIVINIEFQPGKRISDKSVVLNFLKRFQSTYNIDLSNSIYFRFFTLKNSFPLTGSGKRSLRDLEEMNLNDTYIYNPIEDKLEKNNIKIAEKVISL